MVTPLTIKLYLMVTPLFLRFFFIKRSVKKYLQQQIQGLFKAFNSISTKFKDFQGLKIKEPFFNYSAICLRIFQGCQSPPGIYNKFKDISRLFIQFRPNSRSFKAFKIKKLFQLFLRIFQGCQSPPGTCNLPKSTLMVAVPMVAMPRTWILHLGIEYFLSYKKIESMFSESKM